MESSFSLDSLFSSFSFSDGKENTSKRKSVRIQYIGTTIDKTNEFKQRREYHKRMAVEKTKKKMDQLARSFKMVPSNPTIISPLIKALGNGKSHCLSCGKEFGLLNRKANCRLCENSFCFTCIKTLTEFDVTSVSIGPEGFIVCQICFIVVSREEKLQKSVNAQKIAKMNSLIPIYDQLKQDRDAILNLFSKYEYLASSIKLNDPMFDKEKDKKDSKFGEIYELAAEMENELIKRFHSYELNIKQLNETVTSSQMDEKLKQNIQRVMIILLHDHLPQFRRLRKERTKIEMDTINNFYIIISKLIQENKQHIEFWKQFGSSYQQLLDIIRKDLLDAVLSYGDSWKNHHHILEEMIHNWNSGSIVPSSEISKELIGPLIRKNIQCLKNVMKQVNYRVGQKNAMAITSIKGLQELIKILEKEYNS